MHRSSSSIRILSVVVALIFLSLKPLASVLASSARVEKGQLTLDTESVPTVDLMGMWHYFPGRLIQPSAVASIWDEGVLHPVPVIAGRAEVLSYQVVGTLALKIKRSSGGKSLWGLNQLVAYNAFEAFWVQRDAAGQWEERSVLRVGKPMDPAHQTISRLSSDLGVIDWKGTEAYLVIHLSNPNGPAAPFSSPKFGPLPLIQKEEFNRRMESCLVLGMFLMIAIFNVGLFLQRREDKESIWLALCVACLALRFMGTEFLYSYGTETPEPWLLRLQTMSQVNMTAFAMAFYANFLRASHSGYVRKIYLQAYWVACLLYVIFEISFSKVGSRATWISFLIPQFLFALYIVKETLRAAFNRLIGSGYVSVGLGVLVLGLINDFLVFTQGLQSAYLAHYAMVIWTVALTMSIGKQFAIAFRTARRLSKTLKEEVEQQTRNIRSILVNLRQGLFTFDASFRVMPEYSPYTELILKESSLAAKPALELLFDQSNINDEVISIVKSSLYSSLAEDAVAFEMNQDHLPRELIKTKDLQKTIVELDWSPIPNEKGETQQILVTLRDVTEVRRLKSINDENQENLELIFKILSIDEQAFGGFMVNTKALISECMEIATQEAELHQEGVKVIFINLHTVKGNARSYRFDQLTLLLHKLEQQCAGWLHHEPDALTIDQLRTCLKQIQDLVRRYESINSQHLKRQTQTEKIQIDRQDVYAKLVALERIDTRHLDADSLDNYLYLRTKLIDLAYCDPILLMHEVRQLIEMVARDLGHEPPILELSLIDIRLTQKTQVLLKHVFIHLVRNALDHGIERAADRIKVEKPARGLIRVGFEKTVDRLLMTIEDDGRGLALQKLRQAGIACSQLDSTEQDAHTIAMLIFAEGISTAEQVTEISGRGIGMASIKRFLEEQGASIDIVLEAPWKGEDYLPFRFEIYLPPETFVDRMRLQLERAS
jgi:signal transduction histidine kinase